MYYYVVEQLCFVIYFARAIVQFTTSNLIFHKLCKGNDTNHYLGKICTNEDEAQSLSTTLNTYYFVLSYLCFMISCTVGGYWSDIHKCRKPLIMLPQVGLIITGISNIIFVHFWQEFSAYFVVFFNAFLCLFGEWELLNAGGLCYISDISPKSKRTFRIGIFIGFYFVATPIGRGIAGYLNVKLGFINCFLICIVIHTICLIITWFCIDEKKDARKRRIEEEKSNKIRKALSFYDDIDKIGDESSVKDNGQELTEHEIKFIDENDISVIEIRNYGDNKDITKYDNNVGIEKTQIYFVKNDPNNAGRDAITTHEHTESFGLKHKIGSKLAENHDDVAVYSKKGNEYQAQLLKTNKKHSKENVIKDSTELKHRITKNINKTELDETILVESKEEDLIETNKNEVTNTEGDKTKIENIKPSSGVHHRDLLIIEQLAKQNSMYQNISYQSQTYRKEIHPNSNGVHDEVDKSEFTIISTKKREKEPQFYDAYKNIKRPKIKDKAKNVGRKNNIVFLAFVALYESFKNLFKSRAENRTKILVLITLTDPFLMAPMLVENSVFPLFVRYKFHWTEEMYGYFQAFKLSVIILGIAFSIGFLVKFLKVRDTVVGTLASTCDTFACIGYLFVTQSWQMFLVPILDLFHGSAQICSSAIISKYTEPDERGKVFAVKGVVGSIVPILLFPLYNYVYKITYHWFPAIFFILSSFFALPGIIVFMYIHYLIYWKTNDASTKL